MSDPVSEAIYVRDDDTGDTWCPTPLPIRCEGSTYVSRHGAGFSQFEHLRDGIHLSLIQFVPLDDPIKISVLTIENRSGRSRRLSATGYAEWALGTSRGGSASRITTSIEPDTQALLVRNPWNTEFSGHYFFDLGGGRPRDSSAPSSSVATAPRSPAGLDRGSRMLGAVGPG